MSARVTIRLAEPRDDREVGEVLVQAFLTAYAAKMPEVVLPPERLAELRAVEEKRGKATVLVAEREGRVVGTVAVFRPGAEDSQAWLPNAADLRHLAIDPSLQGQGIAAPLLDAAESLVREWGANAICLHVRRGAVGVRRLYEKRGYVRDPSGDLDLPSVSLEALARTVG